MSTKATTKKPASKNSALDKAAADLRKLKAKLPAKKKPESKKKTIAELNAEKNGAIVVAPLAITESTEEIQSLLKKHVVIADDFTSLRIKDEIEIGEYLPIYDFFRAESDKAKDKADKIQFLEGDVFNEGKRLFGKEFSVIMAKEGRPVSTLKKQGSVAANIDTAIRNLHPQLTYSHVAAVAKVPTEAGKLAILESAAKKLDAGESVSVKDIVKEAHKAQPPKPRAKPGAKKVPPYVMDDDEQRLYADFARIAEDLESFMTVSIKPLRALFPKLTGKDKSAMRETLELVAELYALLK